MVRGADTVLLRLLKRAEKIPLGDLAASTRKKTPREVSELVANILAGGIKARATAVHIEPRPTGVLLRHRIDGVLHDADTLPRSALPVIVAGLKILVHLPVAENEPLPQAGSTTVTLQGKTYRLQLATVPSEEGEKAVVHFHEVEIKPPTLHDLGLWGPSLDTFSNAIAQSKGLILLAGPHDSGQPEVAFSALSSLASPETSIATIEDPVIHQIAKATQLQINPRSGLDFETGLRMLLRQDPNVLYISHLAGGGTIQLAIEAALSGRLVFTGANAQSASEAIAYLIAGGVEPYLVAHAIRAAIGQRMVRRLCDNCKELYEPSEQETYSILRSLGIQTSGQLQRVRELEHKAITSKLVIGASPASDTNFMTHLYRPSPDGCAACSHTGYKGLIGIYEVLSPNENIQRLILSTASPTLIESQAAADGMSTMHIDGLVKVLVGLTSVEELMKQL